MEAEAKKDTAKSAEKNGSSIGSIVGTVALAAASVAGGWMVRDMMPAKVEQKPVREAPATSVAVAKAELREYNLPEKFIAHAEPVQEVELLPQVDGYIKEVKFKEGDIVKEGQLLYVLDDERYRAVVNQRKADLEAAEAEARRAERYWERMQKADARGITQLERDNAEAGAEKSKAAVLQAKANLVVAEYDLKKARVIAPIAGQIGKTSAHVGDYVAPSKGALAKIVQIDPIRVTFPLTDRAYVGWRTALLAGKDVDRRMRIVLPTGDVYNGVGTFAFDDNTMNADTATITMRLSFPNPDRLLVPNTYVTLIADLKTPPKKVCVPQSAIFDLPGGNVGVWVLKSDNTVVARAVTTEEMSAGWVPCLDGVKEGETVVVSGTSKLADGMKVYLADATPNEENDPNYKTYEERTAGPKGKSDK